jgi:hypothetical protein
MNGHCSIGFRQSREIAVGYSTGPCQGHGTKAAPAVTGGGLFFIYGHHGSVTQRGGRRQGHCAVRLGVKASRDGRRQSVARERSGLPDEMGGTEPWSDAYRWALAFVRAAGHANTRHDSAGAVIRTVVASRQASQSYAASVLVSALLSTICENMHNVVPCRRSNASDVIHH